MMLYTVTAYVKDTELVKKTRELKGFSAVEAQQKIWENQGYEVDITMQCTKYICLKKAKMI